MDARSGWYWFQLVRLFFEKRQRLLAAHLTETGQHQRRSRTSPLGHAFYRSMPAGRHRTAPKTEGLVRGLLASTEEQLFGSCLELEILPFAGASLWTVHLQ